MHSEMFRDPAAAKFTGFSRIVGLPIAGQKHTGILKLSFLHRIRHANNCINPRNCREFYHEIDRKVTFGSNYVQLTCSITQTFIPHVQLKAMRHIYLCCITIFSPLLSKCVVPSYGLGSNSVQKESPVELR
jgi:hypothetical protein